MHAISAFLSWLFAVIFGPAKPLVDDYTKEPSEPRPDIKVVEPVIKKQPSASPWYATVAMENLLTLIRSKEAPAGYNQRFAEAKPKKVLAHMSFDEVRSYGRARVTVDKKASSAIGGYQFITKTLDSLKISLGLTGREMFTETFQDDLAIALMIRRGLLKYLRDQITAVEFCNNLAKEWASLPVVSPIQGAHRRVSSGQSYYAGDGLNAAHHKPAKVLEAVTAMKASMPDPLPIK